MQKSSSARVPAPRPLAARAARSAAAAPPAGTATTAAKPAAAGRSDSARPEAAPAQRGTRRVHDHRGHHNEVVLAGRVTAEPAVRELPSGDHLVTWRISVTRPPAEQRPNQPSDPITCVSFDDAIEAATRGWRIGDIVHVSGALRRRFWRSPGGSSSVIEVEVRAARRIPDGDPPGDLLVAGAHQPS